MGIKFSQFIRAFDITDDAALVGLQDGSNKRFSFGLIKQWIEDFLTPADIGAQEEITASGILKGDGQGGVSAATAGTDYGTYSKPSGGIPSSDMASGVQTSLGKADTAYQKPSGGIPASDLASGVIPTVPSAYTSNPAMDGTASPGSTGAWADGGHVHPSDTSRIALAEKGAANGVASLDSTGKVPSSQLPTMPSNVEANPSGAATDTLTKLQVDQTIYAIDGIDYLTVVNGQICVVYEVTP